MFDVEVLKQGHLPSSLQECGIGFFLTDEHFRIKEVKLFKVGWLNELWSQRADRNVPLAIIFWHREYARLTLPP